MSGHSRIDRRHFLELITATPFVAAACTTRDSRPAPAAAMSEFTIDDHGTPVRCLYHEAGDASQQNRTAIILLHGASADAAQWTDIGLVDALDQLAYPGVRSAVAIAPDIGEPPLVERLVLDTVVPVVIERFAPDHFAISGISRGGAMALTIARREPTRFGSVGLHSAATNLTSPIEPVGWRCWVDVGTDDHLRNAAATTANSLRASGVTVEEHVWPGGHDRAYWRRHLTDYLDFHVNG